MFFLFYCGLIFIFIFVDFVLCLLIFLLYDIILCMNCSTLIDCQKSLILLKEQIANGNNASGYLFLCENAEELNEYAQAISNLFVCSSLCGECQNCIMAKNSNHPDILVYPKENNFSVEDAFNVVDNSVIKPMIASKKVFVLKQIDNGSVASQNKLLKVLETPPNNVIFLVFATDESKVLQTIKSRLNIIFLQSIGKSQSKELLKEFECNENFENVIAFCESNYFRAKSIFENVSLFEKCFEFAQFCVFGLKNTNQMTSILQIKSKEEVLLVLEIMQSLYLDLLKQKLGGVAKYAGFEQLCEKEISILSLRALTIIVGKINNANKQILSNVSSQMVLETLLVDILEVKFLCK